MLPSDGCTTVISHPWQHFTGQMLQYLPKLQNFLFNFEKPGYYSTGLKNHCFGRTFLENIWDLVKSFCCIGIPGEILFQSCSSPGNLFRQHSFTDKEGSNAESTKVTCFCHHLISLSVGWSVFDQKAANLGVAQNLWSAEEIYSASAVSLTKKAALQKVTCTCFCHHLICQLSVIKTLQILDLHKNLQMGTFSFWRRHKCDNGCRWQIW